MKLPILTSCPSDNAGIEDIKIPNCYITCHYKSFRENIPYSYFISALIQFQLWMNDIRVNEQFICKYLINQI